jgi:hypothetical protein
LYYYTGTRWTKTSAVIVNGTQPDLPESGDLWFDITNGNGCNNSQLKIFDGTSWLSVAQDYLSLCGGTMTGDINMSGNSILNLAYPTSASDAANMQYVMDIETGIRTDLTTHINDEVKHLTGYQNTMIDAIQANASGRTSSALGQDIARMRTFTDTFGSNTVVQELQNRISKDENQSMQSGFTITLGRDPVGGSMEAAPASWVEDEIATAIGATGGDRAVRFWSTLSGSALDGDIHVDGTGRAFMRIASQWQQIFPAQYS